MREKRGLTIVKKVDKEKNFKINITTLSPIHIGNGEDYEPINYIIKDNFLYTFDEFRAIEELHKKDQKLPKNDEFINLDMMIEFFKSKKDFIIDNRLFKTKIEVAKDICDLYNNFGNNQNDNELINQMLIHKHISTINPKDNLLKPYIPASSIKGALQSVLKLSVEESQKLKISDSIGIDIKNRISWAIRKGEDEIPEKIEVISKDSTLEFLLSKKNSLKFENIKKKLNSFYQKADKEQFLRYNKEIKRENQFLLRVGRYCGKNFIVENLKEKPKTKTVFRKMQEDKKSELPFGWLLCEIGE